MLSTVASRRDSATSSRRGSVQDGLQRRPAPGRRGCARCCPEPNGRQDRELPPLRSQRRRRALAGGRRAYRRAAQSGAGAASVIEFRGVEKRYDGGDVGLDERDLLDPPRRVRLPRRLDRLGQVDDHAPADQGARADRRRDPRRRPRPSEITRKRVPYYRRNIGVVFQDFKLLPNRTVYDNVAYALQVTGGTRKEIRAKVPDILRLTGLSTKLHNYPDQLSGGEQQRVSIARAFVNHPPLLLADEPTGNLDPETSIGIMQLLYRINRTGTTVLVATHDHAHGRQDAPPRDRALAAAASSATRPTGLYAARRDDAASSPPRCAAACTAGAAGRS